jgi:hypothetical protein
MPYQPKRASLVMTRSGVQFSLAAPPILQYLQQIAPHHRPLSVARYVQISAEPDKNAQPETGNTWAMRSPGVLTPTPEAPPGGKS